MRSTSITSWNVNSLRVRLPHVLDWCAQHNPDILVLQETKLLDENFPQQEIEDAGYQVVYSGQKTYNGVAILSKTTASDIVTDIPELDDPQRRVLAATYNDIRVINVYIPNGQSVNSEKYQYKMDWLEKLQAYINTQLKEHSKLVLLGDFNIAPADEDVHDPEAWRDRILCSDLERDALQRLFDAGLSDTFRLSEQEENQYSWWDYRMNNFKRNRGLRIDLILASKILTDLHQSTKIDKEPRGWERPSDHTPVTATFDNT